MADSKATGLTNLGIHDLDLDNDRLLVGDADASGELKRLDARGVLPTNTYNVINDGAVADFSNGNTDNLTAFQAAYARVAHRSDTVVIPAAGNGSVPGYYVTDDWFGSIGTAADDIPGGVTDIRGRVVLEAGPLTLPNGHKMIGRSTSFNDASPEGSEIWASNTYTGTSNRFIQLGETGADPSPDGTRLENMTVNGRGVANLIGVYADDIQERCGLRDVIIFNCPGGGLLLEDSGSGSTSAKLRPSSGLT